MQLKQLEYLVKIVECGSISRAAQLLYVSQPSLTKSISNLEQEYGIQILVRKARGVDLTPDGKAFVHYARGVLTAANVLETTFSHQKYLTDTQKSRLFLATQQLDFTHDLVLKVYLQNQEKRVHYNVVETNRVDVVKLLLSGAVDLALFVRTSVDTKTFPWYMEAKRMDQYVLDAATSSICVGPKSPFYNRRELHFSEPQQGFMVVLDMEPPATQDLYFNFNNNHNNSGYINREKLAFFNSVNACERFLLRTDATMFAAKWVTGVFKHSKIRSIPLVPDKPGEIMPSNELILAKRAGEPLNFTEKQFVQLLYQKFEKPIPQELRKDVSR